MCRVSVARVNKIPDINHEIFWKGGFNEGVPSYEEREEAPMNEGINDKCSNKEDS